MQRSINREVIRRLKKFLVRKGPEAQVARGSVSKGHIGLRPGAAGARDLLSQAQMTAVQVRGERMRAGRSADRDLALQLAAVRALASKVPLKLSAAPEITVATGDARDAGKREDATEHDVAVDDGRRLCHLRPLYQADEMTERLAWARKQRQDVREGLVQTLERAAMSGQMRRLGAPGSSVEFQELRNEFPHFGSVLDFVWKRAVLAGSVAGAEFRLPPVLLNGPAGCGKTAFAERLAKWVGMPISRVDMSSLSASFSIVGLDAGYSTGKPGVVWNALQCEYLSPVVLLDEIDKTRALNSDGGANFLLGLLEPVSASHFQDAFVGLKVDASHVQWIGTSNDLSEVDGPLRSRFRIFEVREPTDDECVHVVRSVFRALRRREPWAESFPEHLPQAVIDSLLNRTAREVWHALEDACAAAVAQGRRELQVADVPTRHFRSRHPIGFVSAHPYGE
ncbi:AAA family ATPase [Ramlibacter sp. G-1-2-2]|uniref:AAA family ATPase n=1 Tax=Ramlibacter agri TaxID=2728837 RepID=A0A848HJV5_9BURK|nr:AAA family ATPase [Ramlibacter agri]